MQQVGEEAAELIIKSKDDDKKILNEAADLLFQLPGFITGENLKMGGCNKNYFGKTKIIFPSAL